MVTLACAPCGSLTPNWAATWALTDRVHRSHLLPNCSTAWLQFLKDQLDGHLKNGRTPMQLSMHYGW